MKALIKRKQKLEFDKVIQCYLGTGSYSRPKANTKPSGQVLK